jgi:hypothetical protein
MEAYVSYTPAAMIVRIYTGSMGIFYDGTNTKEILYIEGSTGLIGIQTKDQNQSPVFYYAYTDYLGSITELTNESGEVVFEQNFDAWGRRRNAFTVTPRGSTSCSLANKLIALRHANKNVMGGSYSPMEGKRFKSA